MEGQLPGESARGFFKVPRSLSEGPLGKEKRPYSKYEAAIYLLENARYSDSENSRFMAGRLVKWGKGQLPTSIRFLAKAWNWSKDKVCRHLDYLVKENMISVATTQGQTVIQVIDENIEHQIGIIKETESKKDRPNVVWKGKGLVDQKILAFK